jgi:uncharacterized protein
MRRKEREINDIALTEEIIAKADVCRIALSNEDVPYIVTMNFGYQGGKIHVSGSMGRAKAGKLR